MSEAPRAPGPKSDGRGRSLGEQVCYAALDLGTNNCRLLIATPAGGSFRVVEAYSRIVRLGEGLSHSGRLSEAAMERALAALKVLTKASTFAATIIEKGRATQVETYQIAIGNGRHYGGGNVVEQDAEIDDGSLDLYSLELKNVWKLALMLRSFRSGTHGAWQEVRTAKCTEFTIQTRKPMPINADGEIVTATPALFKVHPKAVSIFAPPEGSERPVRPAQMYHR